MLLDARNLTTRVVRATSEELTWLADYLAFDDPKARFTRRGDGKLRVFDAVAENFPSGFLPLVLKAASRDGVAVEVVEHRTPPCARDPQADLEWLRHHPAVPDREITHQIEAVAAVEQHARGILWIPTGGGKTEVAAGLVRAFPCRWLFLVHRQNLLVQTAERYERRTGERAGIVGEGAWDDSERFTVATFQTLHAALQRPESEARATALLNAAEGVIVDEAHTLPAGTFWSVVQRTPRAFFRVGLSGTPLARGDRRSVLTIGALGPVVYRVRPEVLIDLGVLSRPRIRLVTVNHPPAPPPQMGARAAGRLWAQTYQERIVRNDARNRAIVTLAQRAAKPAMIFIKEIAHGRALTRQLEASGLRVHFTSGAQSTEQRMASVRRLERGDVDVLVCSVVFQEGVDIPEVRAVIVASGGASAIATIQRVGRGTRRAAGKSEVEVWDLADRGNRILERHARARLRAYVREGYDTSEVEL